MTTTVWKNDSTTGYFSLNNPHFVTAGNTLTIEKGTIIKVNSTDSSST